MEIVTKNDISFNEFKHYKKVIILGKGPSFKKTFDKDKSNDTFILCINDSINFCDSYDMLVVNDVITWDRLNNEKIKNLKYILSPIYPHYRLGTCKKRREKYNINWVVNKLKEKKFGGKIIFYNLKTSPTNENYIKLDSAISGCNTAVDFVCKYLNINILETRGVGKKNNHSYNKVFEKSEGVENYVNRYINRINDHIVKTLKKYDIKYNQI